MPRPRNKEDLLFSAGKGYSQLLEFIASMSETELRWIRIVWKKQ